MFGHIHVCGYICVYGGQRVNLRSFCLRTCPPCFLRHGLRSENLTYYTMIAGQQATETSPDAPLCLLGGNTNTHHHIWLCTQLPRIELKSLALCSKCFIYYLCQLSTHNIYSLTKLPAYSILSHAKSHFLDSLSYMTTTLHFLTHILWLLTLSHHGLLDVSIWLLLFRAYISLLMTTLFNVLYGCLPYCSIVFYHAYLSQFFFLTMDT